MDSFGFEKPSTKAFLNVCAVLGVDGTILIVTDSKEKNLILSARNVSYAEVALASTLNTYEVLKCDHLVFTRAAFEMVDNRLIEKRAEA